MSEMEEVPWPPSNLMRRMYYSDYKMKLA
jgi:hypothetical protein